MTPEKQAAALWIRLVKCSGLILQRVRRLPARSGLTLAQFDVLAQLLRRPGGMTSGELSRALLVTQGNVTGLVARLARRRLLRSSAAAEAEAWTAERIASLCSGVSKWNTGKYRSRRRTRRVAMASRSSPRIGERIRATRRRS